MGVTDAGTAAAFKLELRDAWGNALQRQAALQAAGGCLRVIVTWPGEQHAVLMSCMSQDVQQPVLASHCWSPKPHTSASTHLRQLHGWACTAWHSAEATC